MATPAETENRYQLTPDQLIPRGFSAKVSKWFRIHNWNISGVQTDGKGEVLFLAAPQNPKRLTCRIRLEIPANGDPQSGNVFLQRYANGAQEVLVAPTPFEFTEPEFSISSLIPKSTGRGRERWLLISKPGETVLGSWKQECFQLNPSGTLLGKNELFEAPLLTSVQGTP